MPRVAVDLTNVKALEVLPPGQYRAQITNAKVKTAKSGDSQVIEWELTVQDPAHMGRKLFINNSLKETALWNLKRFVEAAGASFDATGFDTEQMLGKMILAVVGQEPYEGRVVNRVMDTLKAV